MKIFSAAKSDVGNIRKNNEDNLYCNGRFMTGDERNHPFQCSGTDEEDLQFYAVCDGMGGESHGELASLIASEVISKYENKLRKMSYHSLEKYIEMCFSEVTNRISEVCQDKNCSRVGTTVALLAIENEQVYAFNIGDSRIYQYRSHKLKQLSVDHTPAERDYQLGLIKKEDIKTHPLRHKLTQYLGLGADEFEAKPSVTSLKIKNRDRYLICSDGVTDMLCDKEIAEILRTTKDSVEATKQLIDAAKKNGGRDNVTAVVLDVQCKGFLWF